MTPILTVAIITIAAIILLVTQALRPAVVSLLILFALFVTGLVPAGSLFNSFINSSTLLVLNMFIICGTATAVGIPQSVGRFLIRFAKTERSAIMISLLTSLVLSSFISNMAVTVMMVPIVFGICGSNRKYSAGKLLMAVAIGSISGGFNTLVGNVGNSMTRSFLLDLNYDIGFWGFGKIGLPLSICVTLLMFFFGTKLLPDGNCISENAAAQQQESAAPTWKIIVTTIVFIGVIIGMMFEAQIGVPVHIITMIGVIVLLVSKVTSVDQAFRMVNWPTLIFFAGLLTLSSAISASGAANLVADWIVKLLDGQTNPYIVYAVFFLVICAATQVMSNGAIMSIMIPIGISIADRLGFNPVGITMVITTAASSSFLTPMATPLNAYVMGVGNFKLSDFAKAGGVITVLCAVLSLLLLPLIWPV